MKLESFTLAATSLLIAGTSLLRQHELSQRIADLELRVSKTPPPVIIRFEEPPAQALATLVPPPPPTKQAPPQHHARARSTTTPAVVLPDCNPTDPACGIEKRRDR
jgi:hypothetical protein